MKLKHLEINKNYWAIIGEMHHIIRTFFVLAKIHHRTKGHKNESANYPSLFCLDNLADPYKSNMEVLLVNQVM